MPAKAALISNFRVPENSPLLILYHTRLLELERDKLHSYVRDFGISSPKTLRQSQRVDKLIFCHMNKAVVKRWGIR